ncbi:MAG: nucleotidyltransferase family protein [Pseudomonadota bacterium]
MEVVGDLGWEGAPVCNAVQQIVAIGSCINSGARVRKLYPDVPIHIDAKNEARVHIWYEAKFGQPILPYQSIQHAISTFPTTASAVALRRIGAELQIFAPYGLDDLLSCTVRANKAQITQSTYDRKVERWRRVWLNLKITAW